MKTRLYTIAFILISCAVAQAQNIGIGQGLPKSKLDINGGMTIGSGAGYSGSAISASGAIIQGPVGIGNNAPNSKAILDLSNTSNQGFLLPSITTAAETFSPPAGIMYYNTTSNCVDVYANGKWQPLYCACPTIPVQTIITPTTTVCHSSTGNIFSIQSVTGAASYSWSVSAGTITSSAANVTSITVTAPATGASFVVTCTITNGCGVATISTYTVAMSATTPAIIGPAVVGATQSNVAYSISSPAPGATYVWSVTGGGATPSTGTGTSISVSWSAAHALGTTYSTTVSVVETLCSTTASNSITVKAGGKTPFYANGTWGGSTYGVTSAVIELWGAGGSASSFGADAGGGGFVSGTLALTAGSSLSVIVGGAGDQNGDNANGGGGFGTVDGESGGGGGGRSAIQLTTGIDIATAGGGGGGGTQYTDNVGGGGGGLVGLPGIDLFGSASGLGGSTTSGSGGTGGCYTNNGTASPIYCGTAGSVSQYTGGMGGDDGAGNAGGGGGGGYYGGGGGCGEAPGGGGGGSSYIGNLTGSTNAQGTSGGDQSQGCGLGGTVGGSSNADYVTYSTSNSVTYGVGGTCSGTGNPGLAVIYW